MERRKRIFILGNSLIMNALEDSLQRCGKFDLTSRELPANVQELESMKPDAILFDLDTPHLESVFSLSENCTKVLLVGISPDTNVVKMWVERNMQELSMQSLLTVIKHQMDISLIEGERT